MGRLHLMEIEDQSWCPTLIRDSVTDYLQFTNDLFKLFDPVVPHLRRALEATGAQCVVDLASGGAGPWLRVQRILADIENYPVKIVLTDKFPSRKAISRIKSASADGIDFHSVSIDAANVPAELEGFRTMFTAFHHFQPEMARAILEDAVASGRGIAVFESTERSLVAILNFLFVPLIVLLVTPFIRPFRWSRLFWTYVIPAIPLVISFDGIVSCLRTYSLKELQELSQGLGDETYIWEIGQEKIGGLLLKVTYLVGYPRDH